MEIPPRCRPRRFPRTAGWRKEAGLNHLASAGDGSRPSRRLSPRPSREAFKFQRTADHDRPLRLLPRSDGNQIEIYADVTKNWRTQRAGTIMAPTIKWPGLTAAAVEPQYAPTRRIRRVDPPSGIRAKVTHVVMASRHFEAASNTTPARRSHDSVWWIGCALRGARRHVWRRSLSLFRGGPRASGGAASCRLCAS